MILPFSSEPTKYVQFHSNQVNVDIKRPAMIPNVKKALNRHCGYVSRDECRARRRQQVPCELNGLDGDLSREKNSKCWPTKTIRWALPMSKAFRWLRQPRRRFEYNHVHTYCFTSPVGFNCMPFELQKRKRGFEAYATHVGFGVQDQYW